MNNSDYPVNILDPNMRYIGIGIEVGSYGGVPAITASNGGLADVDDEFDFALTVSGVSAGVTTVHSEKAILNTDDQQHALPGTARGGEAMIIGFEDLTGAGGFDFEDVVLFVIRVEADAV